MDPGIDVPARKLDRILDTRNLKCPTKQILFKNAEILTLTVFQIKYALFDFTDFDLAEIGSGSGSCKKVAVDSERGVPEAGLVQRTPQCLG
jgi:hypothetical protein